MTRAPPFARLDAERPARAPLVRLTAFGALGLYGILRWEQLLTPAPSGRLIGLLALALALTAVATVGPHNRALTIAGVVIAALVGLAITGIPVAWMTHVRIAVIGNAIGNGLGALPRVLVPYNGINEWVRIVTLLGAAVLLLGAAAALALAPRPLNDARRLAAALPLIALAVVPSTLAKPHAPYLQGVILLVLLAAFAWGERIRLRRTASAAALLALAGAVAVAAAPSLDPRHPWWNYQAVAGSFAPGHVESFDWTQRYGPLNWPRTGREVLDVKAQRPDYWKAEDLTVFDGHGWVSGTVQLDDAFVGVDPAQAARFTQTLQVTIGAMQTNDVIGSGASAQPAHLSTVVLPGSAPGTWTSGETLGPGDSYTVRTYSPHPSASELGSISSDAAGAMPSAAYRAIELPATATVAAQPVLFAPYGSQASLEAIPGLSADQSLALLESSPYGRAFALARRLAVGTSTPYAYVAAVEHLLMEGFRYDESPPASAYPLLSFLFKDKIGYCQQFAGAMALLLRLGGIPARVAVGFTTGALNATTHEYVVTDFDAHAWVEAWFPHYGWVAFDPTPTAAPARGGQATLPVLRGSRTRAAKPRANRRPEPGSAARAARGTAHHSGGASTWPLLGVLAVAIALATVLLTLMGRRREPSADELLAELRARAQALRPSRHGRHDPCRA